MRILSWNVNGLRAAAKKGFVTWLDGSEADIVGLQEVRASEEQLAAIEGFPGDWHFELHAAKRPGYSGVGLLSRRAPDKVETLLGEPRFDEEGRVVMAHFGRLLVASVYFPNGNGKDRDNSRVPYKLEFYQRLFERLQIAQKAGQRVLVVGDTNTAHKEIDLARPKANLKTSGFLPEERAELDRWTQQGWVDTFRHFEDGPEHYSWWSQRGGARGRNVGWRLDYCLASPSLMPFLKAAFIWPEVTGSDHCPVGVELDPAVMT